MKPEARRRWSDGRPNRAQVVDAVCVAPWVTLEFDPEGWVYACCANQLYPLGRIGDEGLSDIWHGERLAVLRDWLLRWDMTNGCASCEWHIERGRIDTDAAVYDRYPLAGDRPAGPVAMTFALSNRCNLACVMCNGELSSTIRHAEGRPPVEVRYDDRFFDELTTFLPGLEYAKFLGGEPFLVREHHRVWDLMEEIGHPTRIQVTTNGTIWNERVERVLDRFDVDVTMSIDALDPAVYAGIRRGADLAVVLENAEHFHRHCRDRDTEFRVCMCLMAGNWAELPAMLAWADRLDAPVSVNVVTDEGFALHEMDTRQLEEVARSWRAASPRLERNADVWRAQLDGVEHELSARSANSVPRMFHSHPVTTLGLASRGALAATDESRVDERVELLGRWSTDGEVGVVTVRGDLIEEVRSAHEQLGMTPGCQGRQIDDLLDMMEGADGRPAWLLSDTVEDGWRVVILILNHIQPGRGRPGTVVRLLASGALPDGRAVVLIAKDAIREREQPVSVPVPRRRASDDARPGPLGSNDRSQRQESPPRS